MQGLVRHRRIHHQPSTGFNKAGLVGWWDILEFPDPIPYTDNLTDKHTSGNDLIAGASSGGNQGDVFGGTDTIRMSSDWFDSNSTDFDLNATPNGDFSLVAWLYAESTELRTVCSKWYLGSNNRSFVWHLFNGNLEFRATDDGLSGPAVIFADPSSFPISTWTHAALTYQAGTAARMYVNGFEVASQLSNIPVAIHDASGNLFETARQNGGSSIYRGRMNCLSVWHRALSPAEIGSLYNNGSGWKYSDL